MSHQFLRWPLDTMSSYLPDWGEGRRMFPRPLYACKFGVRSECNWSEVCLCWEIRQQLIRSVQVPLRPFSAPAHRKRTAASEISAYGSHQGFHLPASIYEPDSPEDSLAERENVRPAWRHILLSQTPTHLFPSLSHTSTRAVTRAKACRCASFITDKWMNTWIDKLCRSACFILKWCSHQNRTSW